MRARSVLAGLLVLAATPAAAVECGAVGLSGDLTVSRVRESPRLGVGARGILRAHCIALTSGFDVGSGAPGPQPVYGGSWLTGAGALVDLHPRVAVYGFLVGGLYDLRVRDYALGGWRNVDTNLWAWGGEAGVSVRTLRWRGGVASAPVVGAAVSWLRVPPGSDRLRGISWGGWQPVFTVTLGLEVQGKLRSFPASASPSGASTRPPPRPPSGEVAWTAIHAAAAAGRALEVRALLADGTTPNVHEPGGATPLHLACSRTSNDETVEALLAGGADVGALDAGWATPLHWAASSGRPGAVSLLLGAGARVDALAGKQGYTPLHAAAATGDLASVELLLQAGADVSARDADARTPLQRAEAQGHAAVVARLRRAAEAR